MTDMLFNKVNCYFCSGVSRVNSTYDYIYYVKGGGMSSSCLRTSWRDARFRISYWKERWGDSRGPWIGGSLTHFDVLSQLFSSCKFTWCAAICFSIDIYYLLWRCPQREAAALYHPAKRIPITEKQCQLRVFLYLRITDISRVETVLVELFTTRIIAGTLFTCRI